MVSNFIDECNGCLRLRDDGLECAEVKYGPGSTCVT